MVIFHLGDEGLACWRGGGIDMPELGPFGCDEEVSAPRCEHEFHRALDIQFAVEPFYGVGGRWFGRAFDRAGGPGDASGDGNQVTGE